MTKKKFSSSQRQSHKQSIAINRRLHTLPLAPSCLLKGSSASHRRHRRPTRRPLARALAGSGMRALSAAAPATVGLADSNAALRRALALALACALSAPQR